MWDRYDRAAEAVVAYLKDNGHADTTVTGTRGCLRDLRVHLAESGIPYTRDAALEWLSVGKREWSHGKFKGRRLALCRFDDAWVNGVVTRDAYTHDGSPLYDRLPAWGREIVDSMLAERPRDVPGTKACCARFLLFAESAGATGAECLGPAVTASYVASLAGEPSRRTTYWRLGHVRALLGRLVSAGAVPESTTWFASTVIVKGAGMCAALRGAAAPTSGDGVASANDAARLSLMLVRKVLPQLGYAYGTVKTYENVLLLFCAFLLVNGLDYDPAVGAAWVEANREATGAKWRDHRRALLLLEHIRTSGGIPGDRVPLVARADPMRACPEWARGELARYLEFFPNARQENLFIGMIHAFVAMGVPAKVLTDNLKCAAAHFMFKSPRDRS